MTVPADVLPAPATHTIRLLKEGDLVPDVHTPEQVAADSDGTTHLLGESKTAPSVGHGEHAPSRGSRFEDAGLTGNLQRAASTMRQHVERMILHDAGLNWTTFEVLRLVAAHRMITPGSVATNTGLSKAAVTNTSRSLMRRGLINRVLDPNDHRRVYLRPTVDGWRTAVDVGRHISHEERRVLAHGAPGLPTPVLRVLRDLDDASKRRAVDAPVQPNAVSLNVVDAESSPRLHRQVGGAAPSVEAHPA